MLNNEPTLNQIDDYNNNESPQKRRTINLVIALCLVVGLGYGIARTLFSDVSDYEGTPQNPGINTTKGY